MALVKRAHRGNERDAVPLGLPGCDNLAHLCCASNHPKLLHSRAPTSSWLPATSRSAFSTLERTNALLVSQLEALTQERDSLKSRLSAARSRVDALLERLPEAKNAA